MSDEKHKKMIFKNKKKNILLFLAFVIVFAIVTFIAIEFLTYKLYDNINIEAGSNSIKLKDFYKRGRVPKNASFVTDVTKIDLNKVDKFEIEIKEKNGVKKSILHIIDTTPPKVEFQNLIKNKNYVINAEDFIKSKEDFSNIKVEIEKDIIIDDYKDYKVNIIVSDEYGNTTAKECNLKISIIKDYFNLEYGNKLSKEDILYDSKYADYIKQEDIDKINGFDVGDYEIKTLINNTEFVCKIKISDTLPPSLMLKDITIYDTDTLPELKDFVETVSDSSEYIINYKTKLESKVGNQVVIVEAIDKYNNKIEKSANLSIIKDVNAPVFSGLYAITVNKNATINYKYNVSAYDAKDGKVDFTVNTSGVKIGSYGTYYAIYTASDKSGNKTTARRMIIVNHDATDTNAKLIEFASNCGDDYESLRQCVRTKIAYNSSWGGDDPVWQGVTSYRGNCYVHALTYQALLQMHGYQSKLIWTTDKSHYWNLVYINGAWRHSDSTPTPYHSMISASTDAERYANLQGRNWDRASWPEAN